MTTSYELSLKLKELGSPQVGGDYYWVEVAGRINCYHYTETPCLAEEVGNILCRAFTLGELVRELPEISIVKLSGGNYCATCVILSIEESVKFSPSPEEAAGELLAELKQKEVSNG